eukprot:193730-Chlamydomonas_euryale.AAC.1
MVHMSCAPKERAATVRRPTPQASPFLGCLVLLAGWTRGLPCNPTSQPDYLAFCLTFTVAFFSGLRGEQRFVTFEWVVTGRLMTILGPRFLPARADLVLPEC